jgi:hypothetical protein
MQQGSEEVGMRSSGSADPSGDLVRETLEFLLQTCIYRRDCWISVARSARLLRHHARADAAELSAEQCESEADRVRERLHQLRPKGGSQGGADVFE